MKIAVIDLGTNTCNLLIAETNGKAFQIHHQSSQPVKLGDGAIQKNVISSSAMERAKIALLKHKAIINQFGCESVKVFGTSAIRSAENKNEFLSFIKKNTSYQIDVISGDREADLIYKGVLLAFKELNSNSLILDIGGGSNEFILCNNSGIQWQKSFPTGISRVIHSIQVSDPIRSEEIEALQAYFEKEHQPVLDQLTKNKVEVLIGCSGAFDTIADILDEVNPNEKQRIKQLITVDEFYLAYYKLIGESKEELLRIKGINPVRIDLIIPAMILIKQVVEKANIQEIYQTDYALREGVLWEKMRG